MSTLKKVLILNSSILILLGLSITLIDQPLAGFLANNLLFVQPFFQSFTNYFDAFSIYIFWFLAGSALLGMLFIFNNRSRKVAFVLLTSIIVHVAASVTVNIMKVSFKRARPDIYLSTKGQSQDFYNPHTRDYSFPSSHTAFYLSLFLPAALAFRKYAFPLLIIPGIIILGRIVLNEHYLSDVLCSILLVYNLSYITLSLFCVINKALASFINKRSPSFQ